MSAVLWASADLVMAAGVGCLAVGGFRSSPMLLGTAFALLALSPFLVLLSAWLFTGRRLAYPALLVLPVALGIGHVVRATSFVPDPVATVSNLAAIVCLLGGAYLLAFRHPMRLRSRWPLAVLLTAHAATLGLQLVASLDTAGKDLYLPPAETLFGIIHFEAMIFLIGSTIFVVAAMREANELLLRSAADTDPLTGLPNRRAFMDKAARILERCRQDATPVSVIVFDLDHFKSVNDTFGHAVGDRVLRLFADVCRKSLRPNDAVARIGGEEFAVVLTGSGIEAGVAMAERIRRSFGQAATVVEGRELNGTLSAGVTTCETDCDLQELLKQADAGLYRAKTTGRNRVERHRPATPGQRPRIVRVA
jgi:diguanylate cyclase (GGDEF)-like protein